jgi:hypothetical protein
VEFDAFFCCTTGRSGGKLGVAGHGRNCRITLKTTITEIRSARQTLSSRKHKELSLFR